MKDKDKFITNGLGCLFLNLTPLTVNNLVLCSIKSNTTEKRHQYIQSFLPKKLNRNLSLYISIFFVRNIDVIK